MAPRWVWPYDFYLGPIARKCFLPFFFSNIPQPPSSNFPTYHWESILLSVISVYSHNNFCWSLLRGSQIVPLFAVILNQLRNKTKERKADGRKMSHVLSLVVQIPLIAPQVCSFSLGPHFPGSRAVRSHFLHGCVLYYGMWMEVVFLLQTRPIWLLNHTPWFSLPFLWVGREIFRDILESMCWTQQARMTAWRNSIPLTWTPALCYQETKKETTCPLVIKYMRNFY